jgi:hypothetical protein
VDSSLNHVTTLDASAGWLLGTQRNDTSQFGEDGLIESVFSRVGETNRWCFEVGAADGLFFSNTKRLRDAGWHSVLIEAGDEQFEKLQLLANVRTHVVHERINFGALDRLLGDRGAPEAIDLGVIDIDGQDYWAWKGMQKYRPRVMLVEFAYFNPPTHIPREGDVTPDQAGLQAIVNLGVQKGYTALVSTYCNVLFARKDVWASN